MFLLASLLILFAIPVAHSAVDEREILKVSHNSSAVNIAEYTYSYREPAEVDFLINSVTMLADKEWTSPSAETPNFGYTEDTYWFKLSLQAKSTSGEGRYYYQVYNPVADYIDVYVVSKGQITAKYIAGDSRPFSERTVKSNAFDFPLDLKVDEPVTLFIRLKSEGTVQLPATLFYENDYLDTTLAFYIGQGVYFGIVGIMLFYNFFLFFVFKSKDYLYYVLYGASIGILQLTMHGFSFQYLWPEALWWNNKAIPVTMLTSALCMLLFTLAYFRLKAFSPRITLMINMVMGLLILGGLAALYIPYGLAIKLAVVGVILSVSVCIFSSIIAWKNKAKNVKIYWFAWSVMFAGAISLVFQKLGIVPTNFLTSNSWQLGTGIEIIVLSFGLGFKIKDISAAKLNAEQETRLANKRALDIQITANEELEVLVDERTEKLRIKNRDMLTLLDNIKHGLLTINEDGRIEGEYSAYLETILGTNNIAGKSCFELLFEPSTLSEDKLSLADSAVTTVIGDDDLCFGFNEGHLPSELMIMKGQLPQSLELEWLPLVNAGVVEHLMVSIRDVTEANVLRDKNKANEMEWQLITLFLKAGEAQFREYILSNTLLLTQSKHYLLRTGEEDQSLTSIPVDALFRNMHTIKGNSRAFDFDEMSDFGHQAESLLSSFRETEITQSGVDSAVAIVDNLLALSNSYKRLAVERIGWDVEALPSVAFSKSMYFELCEFLKHHKELQEVKTLLPKLIDAFYQPLHELLHIPIQGLGNIAHTLNKPVPIVTIEAEEVLFASDQSNFFNSVFNHLFRNSLDHGIEDPEERVNKGKPGAGKISVLVSVKGESFSLKIFDDGQGLNLAKLRHSMEEKGQTETSLHAIGEFVFSSGTSTAEALTDISGRGVGLDAVRAMIINNGGNIRLVFDLAESDSVNGFLPFHFQIELPKKSFILE